MRAGIRLLFSQKTNGRQRSVKWIRCRSRALSSSTAPINIEVQTISNADIRRGPLLKNLYELAIQSVEEEYHHFCDHAVTNDICHVFTATDPSSSRASILAGFQFWRFQPECAVHDVSLIWGGKIRFRPDFRKRGLNLWANVMAYERFAAQFQIQNTQQKTYRIGLVNVFGYNSIAAGLNSIATFPFANGEMRMSVVSEISRFCDENNFIFDEATGTVDVGQTFPADRTATLEESGFWNRPAVRDFLKVNPQWQDRDVFVAWEWDDANLSAMRGAAEEKAVLTSTYVTCTDVIA